MRGPGMIVPKEVDRRTNQISESCPRDIFTIAATMTVNIIVICEMNTISDFGDLLFKPLQTPEPVELLTTEPLSFEVEVLS